LDKSTWPSAACIRLQQQLPLPHSPLGIHEENNIGGRLNPLPPRRPLDILNVEAELVGLHLNPKSL
jgi:hypothetical protein